MRASSSRRAPCPQASTSKSELALLAGCSLRHLSHPRLHLELPPPLLLLLCLLFAGTAAMPCRRHSTPPEHRLM